MNYPSPLPVRPLLLGHRGALRYATENTIAAFDLTMEHGCDGFEFDVRLTADGQAVVIHDPAIHGVAVADSTLTDIEKAAGFHVPTLDEVLRRYAERAFLDIELKVPGLEEHVAKLAEAKSDRILVSSFLPEVVEAVHKLSPALPLGYICKDPHKLPAWHNLPVSFVILHHSVISEPLLRELSAAGKQTMVWTVNDIAEMVRFAAMGVEGIISDDTHQLRVVVGAGAS